MRIINKKIPKEYQEGVLLEEYKRRLINKTEKSFDVKILDNPSLNQIYMLGDAGNLIAYTFYAFNNIEDKNYLHLDYLRIIKENSYLPFNGIDICQNIRLKFIEYFNNLVSTYKLDNCELRTTDNSWDKVIDYLIYKEPGFNLLYKEEEKSEGNNTR